MRKASLADYTAGGELRPALKIVICSCKDAVAEFCECQAWDDEGIVPYA